MLPVVYLRGLSAGDFARALAEFFGTDAGLSLATITRLIEIWSGECAAFESRDLSDNDHVYVRADGVHFRIRLEEDQVSCLVVIGAEADGTRRLPACADGYRESTESWAEIQRDLKNRGVAPPMVAVGDVASGFWTALGEVFPATREQRCWVHKTTSILDALPKRLHRIAGAALHESYESATKAEAKTGIDDFERIYGDKYPRAVAKLTRDRDVLLTFYDYPAAHWTHLRTTNPIELTFATARARTKVTKGAASRRGGLVLAYKLLDAAEDRRREANRPKLVAQVRAGIAIKAGIEIEGRAQRSRDAAQSSQFHPQDLVMSQPWFGLGVPTLRAQAHCESCSTRWNTSPVASPKACAVRTGVSRVRYRDWTSDLCRAKADSCHRRSLYENRSHRAGHSLGAVRADQRFGHRLRLRSTLPFLAAISSTG